MSFKSNKGVTLMALTITIIVMLIISSIIINNTGSHIKTEKVNKLYNDIENLNNKIEDYYMKYGNIPTLGEVYCNKNELDNILTSNAEEAGAILLTYDDTTINPNDGDEYYVIDLEKLDGLTLNYGYDDYKLIYNAIEEGESTEGFNEIYIINKETHQIYYPSGIVAYNQMYYVYNLATEGIFTEIDISSTLGKVSFKPGDINELSSFKIYANSVGSVGDLIEDTSDENYGKYKVPVTVSGKNLFGVKNLSTTPYKATYEFLENDAIKVVATDTVNSCAVKFYPKKEIILKAGKTYYLSCDIVEGSNVRTQTVGLFTTTGTYLGYFPCAYTPTEDVSVGIYIYAHNDGEAGEYVIVNNIQIEEGTEATEYNPYIEPITTNIYLNEPLRNVGDVSDYIDMVNKKVVRRIDVNEVGELYVTNEYTLEGEDVPDIKFDEGVCIIEVDTQIQPGNLEFKYLKIK